MMPAHRCRGFLIDAARLFHPLTVPSELRERLQAPEVLWIRCFSTETQLFLPRSCGDCEVERTLLELALQSAAAVKWNTLQMFLPTLKGGS